MTLRPGARVQVGPTFGEVVYVQHVGCCGGQSVAVRLDDVGRIVYVKPNELRLLAFTTGYAPGSQLEVNSMPTNSEHQAAKDAREAAKDQVAQVRADKKATREAERDARKAGHDAAKAADSAFITDEEAARPQGPAVAGDVPDSGEGG